MVRHIKLCKVLLFISCLRKKKKKITLSCELPEDERFSSEKIQLWEEPFIEVITYKILEGKFQ